MQILHNLAKFLALNIRYKYCMFQHYIQITLGFSRERISALFEDPLL